MADAPAKPAEPIDFQPAASTDRDIESTVAGFIERAVELRASDLFFTSDENHVGVLARRLGSMMELAQLSTPDGRRCMNHIKAMSGLDLAERRRALDGRWIYHRQGHNVDLRINALPTLYGEDLTIRVLDHATSLRQLDRLGLLRSQLDEVHAMLNSAGGLILATGPNGAGKTTTLYACLEYLNDSKRKINTIEDPIEYAVDGLRQSQINHHVELDFPELLRAVLRQSPDIIMIGEIRDSTTAQTVIRAANSGHLVLSTLHAPVAAGALQSMLALNVHPHFLSTCLRGVITQRLVRVLCPRCRKAIELDESAKTFDDVKPWLEPGTGKAMYAPAGCDNCRGTGYVDRTGVFEVLPCSSEVRRLIANGVATSELENRAIAEGMLEFRRSGMVKVAQGITTTEELLRVIPSEYLGLEA
ncbi:MAG TPA: GspE/PulE family protein [Pirellulales bacterium]|jgi:type II secretory ATPase GspE/PulE/Tfp pilus assembly ATPase PilB-like protein|nr:GspE/PulE family protein [Pirellulales bacterium]